jgi:hypothetical protein
MGSLPLALLPSMENITAANITARSTKTYINETHAGATHHNPPLERLAVPADQWSMHVTHHRFEREAAFRLVHQVYLRSGLTTDQPMGMRVMKHHLSDQTDVLVTKRNDAVVLTSTLVRDAQYGLPLESLFAEEVNEMRAAGLRLAEISALASDASLEDKNQRFELLVKIISLTFQTARNRGVDRLLLAVHPRHAKIYHRLFGCTPCSEVKEYAAVEGNPAVLCMHDFAQMDVTRYPMYNKIYGANYTPWQLAGTPMCEAEKWHLSQAVTNNTAEMMPMAA